MSTRSMSRRSLVTITLAFAVLSLMVGYALGASVVHRYYTRVTPPKVHTSSDLGVITVNSVQGFTPDQAQQYLQNEHTGGTWTVDDTTYRLVFTPSSAQRAPLTGRLANLSTVNNELPFQVSGTVSEPDGLRHAVVMSGYAYWQDGAQYVSVDEKISNASPDSPFVVQTELQYVIAVKDPAGTSTGAFAL